MYLIFATWQFFSTGNRRSTYSLISFKIIPKVEGLRDEADKAKRECLEVKKIAEEKEVLFKQEQAALRKVRYNPWCSACEIVYVWFVF